MQLLRRLYLSAISSFPLFPSDLLTPIDRVDVEAELENGEITTERKITLPLLFTELSLERELELG